MCVFSVNYYPYYDIIHVLFTYFLPLKQHPGAFQEPDASMLSQEIQCWSDPAVLVATHVVLVLQKDMLFWGILYHKPCSLALWDIPLSLYLYHHIKDRSILYCDTYSLILFIFYHYGRKTFIFCVLLVIKLIVILEIIRISPLLFKSFTGINTFKMSVS